MDPELRCMDPIKNMGIFDRQLLFKLARQNIIQYSSAPASEGVRGSMPHNAQRLLD